MDKENEYLFEVDEANNQEIVDSNINFDMPLAARLRPRKIDDYVGQKHLLAEGKLLRRTIQADRFSSILLVGPPGCGKTSLAELIASLTNAEFIRLSGVNASVSDVRKVVAQAIERKAISKRKTMLFIDEIHRFSKSQQDSLLPDVENGNIRLVGATTHNPQFYIVSALLSRSLLFQLEALTTEDIIELINKTLRNCDAFQGRKINMSAEACAFLAESCEGDARRALNALEIAVLSGNVEEDEVIDINIDVIAESIQKKVVVYGDDGHYDCASALIKSMRGSDPNAAVYYLARMLQAGEDIRFIARRIVILAAEDIGNADPRALSLAVAAMQAVDMIGMPEARIILSQAVTYCASAPKSNAAYCAINEALKDVENNRLKKVPSYLRDQNSTGARKEVKEHEYLYPHDFGGFVVQKYMEEQKSFYRPKDIGYEAKIAERMRYWESLREEASK